MKHYRRLLVTALLVSTLFATGCSTISNQQIGAGLGSIAGAVLGSKVGQGTGKVAATALGGVVGGWVGSDIGAKTEE